MQCNFQQIREGDYTFPQAPLGKLVTHHSDSCNKSLHLLARYEELQLQHCWLIGYVVNYHLACLARSEVSRNSGVRDVCDMSIVYIKGDILICDKVAKA